MFKTRQSSMQPGWSIFHIMQSKTRHVWQPNQCIHPDPGLAILFKSFSDTLGDLFSGL